MTLYQRLPFILIALAVAGLGTYALHLQRPAMPGPEAPQASSTAPVTNEPFQRLTARPSDEEIKARLTPLQFAVTQEDQTETPYENEYWDHHDEGIYVDVVTGEPLFSSKDKYDSKTGWPSFTKPLAPELVVEREDSLLGYARTEVRSRIADSHLGHVFDDGPADRGGKRYCMNSAALRFVPAASLEAAGYGEYARLF